LGLILAASGGDLGLQDGGGHLLPPRPLPQRLLVRSWAYRHPALQIGVRITVGTWDLALAMFLLSYGHWVGLVPLAGSALILWTAYIVARGRPGPGATGTASMQQ
jgi:hypothetical protein